MMKAWGETAATLTICPSQRSGRLGHCCIQSVALQCLTVGSDLGRMGRAGASNLTGLQFQRAEVPGPQSQNFLAEQRIKFSILHSVHGRRELHNHLRIPALSTRPNSYVHCMTVE